MINKDLSEVQKQIVTAPVGASIVTAGAGSGKTRVLTNRILYLLENGFAGHEILALTFTNKAAGEMRRRIEEGLGGECKVYLGTFHAWCARFLRMNIGPPYTNNFTIYDAKDSAKIMKEVDDDPILYAKKLEASNAIDFNGLLEKTHEILSTNQVVREHIQKTLRYILVDEFQDTNEIQYNIVKILAGYHKNITVVGDEDQCIYSWRGANIGNLESFLKDFPDVKIFKLEQNFRSAKNIVDMANLLISHNTTRLDKVLHSNLPSGKIRLNSYFDERHEARSVAMQIASERNNRGTPYKNFAVLMRMNATTRNFEEEFRSFGIPHLIWGGFKFYERAEIKSTINYLRILCNPKDEAAVVGALGWPKRGVGETTIAKLRDHATATGVCLLDAALNPPKLPAKASQGLLLFKETVASLKNMYKQTTLGVLAKSLISTIGIEEFLDTGKEEDASRLENVRQLEIAIKSWAHEHPFATLDDYLQNVALVQDTDTDINDAVVISTIHSAKGLEFDTVFIVALEDGIFPTERSKESYAQHQEERRLLYVAATRAMRNLYLSHAESRYFMGSRNIMQPSPFLEECGLLD
ncbi:MAG: ATP-dependent helicase [Firmicutes bacterium]|nr:ATP-dependent helicase [Bacillota bacterium]